MDDLINSVFADGVAIGVELTYARFYAIRLVGTTANTIRYGEGGGYAGQFRMERAALESFLKNATGEDPEVRRGPKQEVWPLGRK